MVGTDRLRYRKSPEGRLFEAGLHHLNEYLYRIRKRLGSERTGIGSAFHQLCLRYNGTLIPTAPTAIRLWKTFTFTFNWPSAVL